LRLNDIEEDGISIVSAGNASEVMGCGLELVIGVGGVRVIFGNISSISKATSTTDVQMRRKVPTR
jgi:hypothetical protein